MHAWWKACLLDSLQLRKLHIITELKLLSSHCCHTHDRLAIKRDLHVCHGQDTAGPGAVECLTV